jgi:hypothetical protein
LLDLASVRCFRLPSARHAELRHLALCARVSVRSGFGLLAIAGEPQAVRTDLKTLRFKNSADNPEDHEGPLRFVD